MKTHLSLDPGLAMGGTNPPGPHSAQKARLLSAAGQTNFQTFPRDQSPIIHPSVKSGDWRGEGQRAQELRASYHRLISRESGRQTVASATNLSVLPPPE